MTEATVMDVSTSQRQFRRLLPFIVCGLAATFYVYEFFLRVMPSVMTHELMLTYGIAAPGLGVLSSLFFWGYTPMQIPAGLLYDRFGPRVLLTLAMLMCALGTLLFAMSSTLLSASVARFAMGFASAFAYIGALVLAARWFSLRYFALIAGLIQMMGCFGAIAGEEPIAVSIRHFGWRPTIYFAALIGGVLAVLFWLIIRDYPHKVKHRVSRKLAYNKSKDTEWIRLKRVCGNPQTWCVGVYSFSCWAPISIFATLWGVPYLNSYYHTNTGVSGFAIAMVWIGIAIGSPVLGWWSNFINNRRVPLILCASIALISSLVIVYMPHLSWDWMLFFLFFFGFAAGGQSVSFGVVQDNNMTSTSGTAVGFNNMAIISGAMVLLPLVGTLLKYNWSGQVINYTPVYSIADYRIALIILPTVAVIGIIASLFLIKETHCQPQYVDQRGFSTL